MDLNDFETGRPRANDSPEVSLDRHISAELPTQVETCASVRECVRECVRDASVQTASIDGHICAGVQLICNLFFTHLQLVCSCHISAEVQMPTEHPLSSSTQKQAQAHAKLREVDELATSV